MKNPLALLDSPPLVLVPELALAIGLNEAIVIQQLHYWIGRSTNEYEGKHWVFNSYKDWQAQFPWWSEDTIERTFRSLQSKGLILVEQIAKSKMDRRNWYTINYEELEIAITAKCGDRRPQNAVIEDRNLPTSNPANCDDLNKETEITTETTVKENKPPSPKSGKPGVSWPIRRILKRAIKPDEYSEPYAEQLFDDFMHAYPPRSQPHTKAEARAKFFRLIYNEKINPFDIIRGALNYANHPDTLKKVGTEFIPDARTWLNQSRWAGYQAKPEPVPGTRPQDDLLAQARESMRRSESTG